MLATDATPFYVDEDLDSQLMLVHVDACMRGCYTALGFDNGRPVSSLVPPHRYTRLLKGSLLGSAN